MARRRDPAIRSTSARSATLDEYSASKAAADLALGALVPAGLKCVRFRPFNHTGRGQSEHWSIPAFAMQVARIEAGLAPPTLRVGNLDAERDILDVADVVDAYALALYAADDLEPGDILNIAAGRARRIGDMLTELLKFSRREIAVERDSRRVRRSDLPILVGDSSRLRAKLGWALRTGPAREPARRARRLPRPPQRRRRAVADRTVSSSPFLYAKLPRWRATDLAVLTSWRGVGEWRLRLIRRKHLPDRVVRVEGVS